MSEVNRRRSPWVLAIVVGLAVVVVVNAVYVYVAVSGRDPVVASYISEAR